ncbi:hypothetical protein [Thalassotalea crassostreae]|uniref:hypothetical protein n=1 Tax=Thalassotalea crassostreae TaxID=1763536 RepID=UPI00083810C4|nr:hypothetical protein [Thalassotalea crassostreae]
MNLYVVHSPSICSFLVYASSKTDAVLLEELRKIEIKEGQEESGSLISSADVIVECYANGFKASEKDTWRFKAVESFEKKGYKYLGSNRGIKPADNANPTQVAVQDGSVHGIGDSTSFFLALWTIFFWLLIVVSLGVMFLVSFITGLTLAISIVLGGGLVFLFADILKNVVEINQKLAHKE